MTEANQESLLRKLLDTEMKPEKQVWMKRFDAEFHIQALDGKTINRIREQASYPTRNGKQVDEEKFGALLIEKACLMPDWTDKALLDAFGPTPTDVVQKRLLAGEIVKLTGDILQLSGFGDEDEAVEEAKN